MTGIDIGALAPDLARLLGVQPSTLVLLVFLVTTLSRGAARRIPSTATGFWGFMRQLFAVLGIEVANRVTADTTSMDVLKAAAQTPPIPETIEAEKQADA